MAQSVAIRHARIFDGSTISPDSTVVVQDSAVDGHDLLGVLFSASPTPGTFAFQIDDVRFI